MIRGRPWQYLPMDAAIDTNWPWRYQKKLQSQLRKTRAEPTDVERNGLACSIGFVRDIDMRMRQSVGSERETKVPEDNLRETANLQLPTAANAINRYCTNDHLSTSSVHKSVILWPHDFGGVHQHLLQLQCLSLQQRHTH